MIKRARRTLSVAAAVAVATLAAAPAMAAESPEPKPEVLESQPPPVESTGTRTGDYHLNFRAAFLESLA